MKCVVPGTNIRLLGKAILSLGRIGEELYIEHIANGVAFRTVNSSRSAYACFTFAPAFFERYNNNFTENSEEVAKCKIAMKSCTSVFKNLSTLEKTVERCKITLDSGSTKVVFQLHCKHGIVRTFNLAYIECETLQAVFSKNRSSNNIVAPARLLSDTVQNFQVSQEEVTLIASSEKMVLKNYTDDEPDPTRVVHTEMTLDPEEFDGYEVELETDLTFCMKELRALLSFSEVCNFPVSIYFESSGKPVVFSLENNPMFKADFVLATLGSSRNSSQSSVSSNKQTVRNKNRATKKNARTEVLGRAPAVSEINADPQTSTVNQIRNEENHNGHRAHSSGVTNAFHAKPHDETADADNEFLHDLELQDTVAIPVGKDNSDSSIKAVSTGYHHTVAPLQLGLANDYVTDSDATTDGEGAANDAVPGTPPSKKFKSMFLGLSQASHVSKNSEVLASDTDEED